MKPKSVGVGKSGSEFMCRSNNVQKYMTHSDFFRHHFEKHNIKQRQRERELSSSLLLQTWADRASICRFFLCIQCKYICSSGAVCVRVNKGPGVNLLFTLDCLTDSLTCFFIRSCHSNYCGNEKILYRRNWLENLSSELLLLYVFYSWELTWMDKKPAIEMMTIKVKDWPLICKYIICITLRHPHTDFFHISFTRLHLLHK